MKMILSRQYWQKMPNPPSIVIEIDDGCQAVNAMM
jgi:hypothetical protein